MGWWSPTIMGGDTPLDIECEWDEKGFNKKPPTDEDLKHFFDCAVRWTGGERFIGPQVVTVLMMRYGWPISDELRERLLDESTEDETDAEGWNDPAERLRHVANLQATLRNYDGTPTEVAEEGLFEKIAEGMVNDNI